jgi:hypothetical protein
MMSLLWLPIVLQIVAPIALLTLLAMGREKSDAAWVLTAVSVGLYLGAIAIAGLWLLLPWYTPFLYALLFIAAIVLSLWRAEARGPWPPRKVKGWFMLTARALVCVLILSLAAYAASGQKAPPSAVNLKFPFRQGDYLVVNGGSNTLLNAHLEMRAPRFRAYRGSAYGVDIVRVNRLGFRARGLLPADLGQYTIFGDPIFSPCGGEVLEAIDGVREMTPPRMDRAHMAGNHVLIKCGDVWILLGHMKRGSVAVGREQQVATGDLLGRVGNTGNTNEPHLHIHAQTPGTASEPLSGNPLPIVFDGRFAVRNDLIRAPSE